MISQVTRRLRTDGFGGTVREIGRRVRRLVYLREEHTWWEQDLDDRPSFELGEELRFVRATTAEADAVGELGQDPQMAHDRLAAGNDLWLVFDGEQPLFACYTFRQTAPVMAASGGHLDLPEGAACLEDSLASPAARGRGIAPATWTLLGDRLREEGFKAIVTKIETSNKSSNRAVEKVGFRPIAVMEHERVVLRRNTAVRSMGTGLGEELAARLT